MGNQANIINDQIFKQACEAAQVLIFAVDQHFILTYANPYFCQVHNTSANEIFGTHLKDVIGEQGFNNNASKYDIVFTGRQAEKESSFKKLDGKIYYYKAVYTPMIENNIVVGFTGVVIDITAEKELEILSITDELTGINNRRKFEMDFSKTFYQSSREQREYGLLFLDIDFFKKINDNYGHAIGDIALKKFSQIITKILRVEDRFYRIGGEEFAVLCRRVISAEQLEAFANRLCSKVREGVVVREQTVTVSIGGTIYNQLLDKEFIYKRCDEALYLCKEQGRDRVAILR